MNIDQKCMGCPGNATNSIVNQFKVACLNYAPSPMQYRNKVFKRDEVSEIVEDLLDFCVATMDKTAIYKENSIFPKRFYDDLILARERGTKLSTQSPFQLNVNMTQG